MNNSNIYEKRNTILGISPGTRYTGLAVFRHGVLIEWKVKTFYGKTTEKKLQRILDSIEVIIDSYAVDSIAIKIPEGNCISKKVEQIIVDIEKIAVEKERQFFRCNISELKQTCLANSRQDVAKYLMQKYPAELSFVEHSGLNRHAYYGKMFEAVAAGMRHSTKTQLPTSAIFSSYVKKPLLLNSQL